jgi:hypothetical protein
VQLGEGVLRDKGSGRAAEDFPRDVGIMGLRRDARYFADDAGPAVMRRGEFCHGEAEARREHGVTWLVESEVGARQFRCTVCRCRPAWVLRECPQAGGYRVLPRFGGVRLPEELSRFLFPAVGG